jgi:putative PIN family toxin of toxin-antitoxin system
VRAVLDPNVLISALIAPAGTPATLVASWLSGWFELVVSDRLLGELERALTYPKLRRRVDAGRAASFLALLRHSVVVRPDRPEPPRRAPDADDDYLLALAEESRAILVSGDRLLIGLADRFPVRTPRDFLDALDADGS